MAFAQGFALLALLVYLALLGLLVTLLVLAIRALLRYLRQSDLRRENAAIRRSLAQAIAQERTRCRMTQEFVAQAIGVSRQAVSKWERGESEPSTSNLFALAKLFDLPVEELLKGIEQP